MFHKHGSPWLDRQDFDSVTVVRLKMPRMLDDDLAHELFDPIYALVAETGRKQIVVNLAAVDRLESLAVGKLVMLNRKVQAANGRLVLCHLTPAAMQTLEHSRLIELFSVCATEEEAVKSFAQPEAQTRTDE